MDRNKPWHMGHKPGLENWKHRDYSASQNKSRQQFIDEYNDPKKYRPELGPSNQGHGDEDRSNWYYGK